MVGRETVRLLKESSLTEIKEENEIATLQSTGPWPSVKAEDVP